MPLPVWEGPGRINKEAWDTSYLLNILMSLAGVSTDLPAFAGSCGLGGRPLLSASGVAANIFCDERDPDSSQTCCRIRHTRPATTPPLFAPDTFL